MAELVWHGKKQLVRFVKKLLGQLPKPIKITDKSSLAILGDNLFGLASLLSIYEGQIDCCYLDPPYNTGNAHWLYDDRSKHQGLLAWLGHEVGLDLKKMDAHDRWLSMMYPRLILISKLLKSSGGLFISINKTESDRLKLLLDEIFGEEKGEEIIVVANPGGRSDASRVAPAHEKLFFYAMEDCVIRGVKDPIPVDRYPLFDGRPYKLLGLRKTGSNSLRADRPNLFYPFYVSSDRISLTPFDGCQQLLPYDSKGREGNWRWGKETAQSRLNELVLFRSRKGYRLCQKIYYNPEKRVVPRSVWVESEISNAQGCRETKALLGERAFPTPKPLELIRRCVDMVTPPDGLVLDAFAGTGTTGQAVWQLNYRDRGTRRFILMEQEASVFELMQMRLNGVRRGYLHARKRIAPIDGDVEFMIQDDQFKNSLRYE